jgi:hypothetical protein
MKLATPILTGLLLTLVAGLSGWLSARIGRTWLTLLLWLIASGLISILIALQSNWIRTFTLWLIDRRFWGRQIYPLTDASLLALVLAGFFVILILAMLALIQDFRLDGIQAALGGGGRMTNRALFLLLLPAPLVFVAGMTSSNVHGDVGATFAMQLVHRVIQTGRTFEGDLFELGLQQGVNFSAIDGVRNQMSAEYSLFLGQNDRALETTIVVAHFDNGAWINCRIIAGQLNFCYDASPPYTVGLASLITGEPIAENCRNCLPRADEPLLAWLSAKRDNFRGQLQTLRLAQQGSQVLMRVESEESDYAIECWFDGISPVRVTNCQEAS